MRYPSEKLYEACCLKVNTFPLSNSNNVIVYCVSFALVLDEYMILIMIYDCVSACSESYIFVLIQFLEQLNQPQVQPQVLKKQKRLQLPQQKTNDYHYNYYYHNYNHHKTPCDHREEMQEETQT